MYLYASKYVSGFNFQREGNDPRTKEYDDLVKTFDVGNYVTDESPSAEVQFTVAYWRKANAIHSWFVRELQDGKDECQRAYAPREKLKELRDLCHQVIERSKLGPGQVHVGTKISNEGLQEIYEDGEIIVDPAVAEEMLPTQSGFFFGSTDYDEYYIYNLRNTMEQIDRVLAMPDYWEFYYGSSW